MTEPPELAFFNSLSGTLEIELSKPPEQIAPNLLNERALPDAKITRLSLELEVLSEDYSEARPLTEDEWNSVAWPEPTIRLTGEAGDPIEHRAPNGIHFTVRDLAAAVEETERQTRGNSEWFGGIDVHHVFFEGILPDGDGVWGIAWGS